jgi:type IV pilus assembly protein PilC
MTLREGISSLVPDNTDTRGDKALADALVLLDREVSGGKGLSEALGTTGAFPEYMIKMTNVGEKTGKLDNVLYSLAEYYERAAGLNSRIRSALMYPAFLFVVMTAIIILLVGKVFPVFEDMLSRLGTSLSDGASAFTAFSAGVLAGRYTMTFMIVLCCAALTAILLNRTKKGRKLISLLAQLFPPLKRINSRIVAARFSSVLSLTISSGMDLGSALEFASDMADDETLRTKLSFCVSQSRAGMPLHKAIQSTGLFSSLNIKFIEAGLNSGSVDEVMDRIARSCETEADEEISSLTSVIEPVIIGVISAVIGIILIAVMLPLVSIMSGL